MQESSENLTNPSYVVPIVILGTDAMLAALPATPVQLAHACLRAGFANVIPASWGDELIAAGVLKRLGTESGPAIQCSCPKVAHRLLSAGGDLRPVMVPFVSPPVAVARYVQSLSGPMRARITYVGACPGAVDDAIDVQISPEALLEMLADRQIVPQDEPRVFEGVIPSDRRRFRSQPGGVPTVDALWSAQVPRTLVEIEGEDISTEIAQHLLSGSTVLIDPSTRLGCVCAGAVPNVDPKEARAHVVAHEPPRATSPVVNELEPIELDPEAPPVPRAPVDVTAVVETERQSPAAGLQADEVAPPEVVPGDAPTPAHEPPTSQDVTPPPDNPPLVVPPPLPQTAPPPRTSPMTGIPAMADPRSGRPPSASPSARPVSGTIPVARAVDGRSLPRAYIARRRSPPRSVEVVPPRVESPKPPRDSIDEMPLASSERVEKPAPPPIDLPEPTRELIVDESPPLERPELGPRPSFPARSRRSMLLIALLGIAVIAGIGVGVLVARSVGVQNPPAAPR